MVGGVGRSGWLWGVLGDPGVLWVAWGVLGVWRVRLGGSFLPKGRASFISPTPVPWPRLGAQDSLVQHLGAQECCHPWGQNLEAFSWDAQEEV